MIDFMARPEPALARIVDLNTRYGTSFPYPQDQAAYGVKVMRDDGLVADPPRSGGFGSFDLGRIRRMVDILRPIYTAQRLTVPGDLSADAVVTNEYLDPSIRMGSR